MGRHGKQTIPSAWHGERSKRRSIRSATAHPGHPQDTSVPARPALALHTAWDGDDAVAVAGLPPVPVTGPRPAVAAVGDSSLGRRVAPTDRAVPPRPQPPAEARRGGRLHGVLVYVTGVLMVLSSVYGVAYSVGDGSNAVTDTASSFRCLFGGQDHHARDRPPAPTETTQDADPDWDPDSGTGEAPTAALTEVEAYADEESTSEADADTEASSTEADDTAPASSAADESPTGGTTSATVTSASPAKAPPSSVPTGTWLSGASGDGVADGSFAEWRGTPVTIAGTWSDNNEAMTELWALQPGAEFGSWDQAVDIAIGGISDDESWEQAARGAYDSRWRESLSTMKELWGSRTAPLYVRFAHEMNGNWYPWSVDAHNRADFVAAWKHFRALQQEIFPAAQLVFGLNRESVGSDFDWRKSFPGAEYVDVIGVDYYNQYPYVANAADWADSLDEVDEYGAPKGLRAHLDFARSVGLPLAVPEWSGHAQNGDSAAWIQGMHDFFAENAGGGAGQLLYEVQFNIDMHGDSYRLFPSTRMPASADRYRDVF